MSKLSAPRCLCIVSSRPVRSGELLAALRTMIDTHEGLEIIVDRRRGESDSAPDRPPADRRRQPSVDARLKLDGFAIVPDPSPFLAGPRFGGVFAGRAIDEILAVPPLDEDDPDEPELARVLDFNRRRKARRRRWLALTLLVGATLVLLLLTLVPTMKALVSPTRPEAPPPAESPSVIAIPPPLPPTDTSPESGGSSQRSESTPPAVERTGRPRVPAQPPAAKRAGRQRVNASPPPAAVRSPEVLPAPLAPPPVAPSPSEATGRSEPAAQAAKAPEVTAPRPQNGASTTSQPLMSPEAVPTRPAPVQPPEAAPTREALERPPDAAPTGQAPSATIPVASPAPSGSSPSDRHVGGFADQFKNLGTVMERDVIEATADAKRQGDDFKALQNRFRRAWDSLKQGFVGPPEKSRE